MKRFFIILSLFLIIISSQAFADSGSIKLLATSEIGDEQVGSGADIFLEVKSGSGRIFIDSFPLTKLDTVMSTRFANEVACDFIEKDCSDYDFFYTIRANAAIVGGPSAGAAISILTISVLEDLDIDESVAITGTINSGGLIGPVGGIEEKIDYAKSINLSTVLIPKWSNINESTLQNITEGGKIEVFLVSNLREALYEMTGKRIGKNYSLVINADYLEAMKGISDKICRRTDTLYYYKFNDTTYNDALELYEKGNLTLAQNKYYSAASYCFGANVKFLYLEFLDEDLSVNEIRSRAWQKLNETHELQDYAGRQKISTITDLQTYMVVTERVLDAEDYFDSAITLLENETLLNETKNISISQLAFGIERLNSAVLWASFFGNDGKRFNLDKDSVAGSCLNKISEVEERLEYLKLYLPLPFDEIRKELRYAYNDYNNQEYSLCLFKASVAKAEINVILNSIGLDEDKIDLLIQDRLIEAEQIMGRQIQNDIFPIVGYSYYEYAKSLRNDDPMSALLYLEYAIELSKLDTYFTEQKIDLPHIESSYLTTLAAGFILGFFSCFVWVYNQYLRPKKTRRIRIKKIRKK